MGAPNNAVRYHRAIIRAPVAHIAERRASFNYTVRYRGEMTLYDEDAGQSIVREESANRCKCHARVNRCGAWLCD
jgi:hypothetical protein